MPYKLNMFQLHEKHPHEGLIHIRSEVDAFHVYGETHLLRGESSRQAGRNSVMF